MKMIITLLAASMMAHAAALKPGDAVTPDAIGAATMIKGDAPKAWEDGKVYIIECWATWCGPCVAAIPHVNELYTTYKDKGLRVIGMNVWEDEKAGVDEFVKKKGDGMSYPVAFVGKDGTFEKTWLVPAGVDGIPHAFVVKNGKLLFMTHPASIEKETIEGLLAGGEKEAEVIKGFEKEASEADAEAEAAEKKEAEAKERLGSFMDDLQGFADKEDHAGALAYVQKTLKENTKLIVDDKQQLTLITGMIYAKLGKEADAMNAFDAAKKIAPDSELGQQIEDIKTDVKEQMAEEKAAKEEEAKAPKEKEAEEK
jgi:thiol-disulfide isomerase/thioredoxin